MDPLVGVVVGYVGARMVRGAHDRGWMNGTFERLSGLALALVAFAGAEAVGGNGFIAAFIAGMTLGHVARERCQGLHHFLEAEGQLLMMLVFLILGSALLWPALTHGTWPVFLYALLSLTVVRMAPTAVALIGSKARPLTAGFVGWFGPRGLASVLFAILIISDADLPHGHLIFSITMVTVLFSVVAHGVTAAPLAAAYGARASDAERCPMENQEAHEHPLRQTQE